MCIQTKFYENIKKAIRSHTIKPTPKKTKQKTPKNKNNPKKTTQKETHNHQKSSITHKPILKIKTNNIN